MTKGTRESKSQTIDPSTGRALASDARRSHIAEVVLRNDDEELDIDTWPQDFKRFKICSVGLEHLRGVRKFNELLAQQNKDTRNVRVNYVPCRNIICEALLEKHPEVAAGRHQS